MGLPVKQANRGRLRGQLLLSIYFGRVGEPLRHNRISESMQTFSNEINMRHSQELDAMMSMMHSQINRAISSAISERVIPKIKNIISSMSSGTRDTESGSLSYNQENNNGTNVSKTILTEKDCGSGLDLRDTEDLVLTR